jgi:hypothetical protein
VTTVAVGGLSTNELGARLGLTFRQLDHLARTMAVDGVDIAGSTGSGIHRVWPWGVVNRLEVAAALSRQIPEPATYRWSSIARAVLQGPHPPPVGWVLLDDFGDVYYARDEWELGRALARGDGGLVAHFALSTPTP